MFSTLGGNELSTLVGLGGGILLGLAARMGRFCTLGAIEDAAYGGSQIRIRMWALALGLSIIGVHLFSQYELINLSESLYLSTEVNLYSATLGGLLFGYGMAICGNCGYGALARLGGGDLRSFVLVLVIFLMTYSRMVNPNFFIVKKSIGEGEVHDSNKPSNLNNLFPWSSIRFSYNSGISFSCSI